MSSSSLPITSQRFAAALTDLPLSSLHAKIAELQNSIAHLEASNAELKEWAAQGDKDCYEAMVENQDVVKRMQERVDLVKREISEIRGLPLEPEEVVEARTPVNGNGNGTETSAEEGQTTGQTETNGRARDVENLSDEEVQRLLNQMREGPVGASWNGGAQQAQNNGAPGTQEEEGVFL